MGKFFAHFVGWFIVFAFSIPVALWNGYVLTVLWGWYMIPAHVPDIGLKTAVGINLIVSYLVTNSANADFDDNADIPAVLKGLIRIFLSAMLGLGVLFSGWLYTFVL